ncbi:multidrug resistance-associated protein 5 [Tanacetum coccineum]
MIDEHVCSRTYEYGSLITSNWIARNYAKKIMINPSIKVKDIVALVLKKYKCKVSVSQARRGKIKALQQYQTCLEDHYGMLWSYAAEILNSNEGSTCKVGVDVMPDGRDGNNQIYPIAWAVELESGAKGWQLTGNVHVNLELQQQCPSWQREPEEYVSEWYRKDKFVSAYSNYIEGLNGLDQWPATSYQKPLPPIIRRMPGRPPDKRKRDAFENDGNRTRLSRKGQVNHCTLCGKSGHNQRACPSKNEEGSAIDVVTPSTSTRGGTGSARGGSASTRGGNTSARGENTSVRGGSSSARGGKTSARGGSSSARGGKTSARGGLASAKGGKTSARGGSTSAKGGKIAASSAPSSPSVGFEMSASQGVRMTGSGIRIRGGVYIRGRGDGSNEARSATNEAVRTGLRTVNGKVVRTKGRGDGSRSRMYPNGIRPIGYGVSWDPVDGETMLGDSMGIPRPAWPEGITPEDVRIHAAESEA